jgi:hypothetical protein
MIRTVLRGAMGCLAVSTLQVAAAQERVGPAYVFSGDRQAVSDDVALYYEVPEAWFDIEVPSRIVLFPGGTARYRPTTALAADEVVIALVVNEYTPVQEDGHAVWLELPASMNSEVITCRPDGPSGPARVTHRGYAVTPYLGAPWWHLDLPGGWLPHGQVDPCPGPWYMDGTYQGAGPNDCRGWLDVWRARPLSAALEASWPEVHASHPGVDIGAEILAIAEAVCGDDRACVPAPQDPSGTDFAPIEQIDGDQLDLDALYAGGEPDVSCDCLLAANDDDTCTTCVSLPASEETCDACSEDWLSWVDDHNAQMVAYHARHTRPGAGPPSHDGVDMVVIPQLAVPDCPTEPEVDGGACSSTPAPAICACDPANLDALFASNLAALQAAQQAYQEALAVYGAELEAFEASPGYQLWLSQCADDGGDACAEGPSGAPTPPQWTPPELASAPGHCGPCDVLYFDELLASTLTGAPAEGLGDYVDCRLVEEGVFDAVGGLSGSNGASFLEWSQSWCTLFPETCETASQGPGWTPPDGSNDGPATLCAPSYCHTEANGQQYWYELTSPPTAWPSCHYAVTPGC